MSTSENSCDMRLPVMAQPSPLAHLVASKVIKHARDIRYPQEHHMWCPDCRRFPVLPVTGRCGHTRCNMCVQKNGACPCGAEAPKTLHLNILIERLLAKMLPNEAPKAPICSSRASNIPDLPTPSTSTGGCREQTQGPERHRRHSRVVPYSYQPGVTKLAADYRQPVSAQARYKYARELLASERYRESVPQLAHVAVSSEPVGRSARALLPQIITVLSEGKDPRRLTRELYRLVREQCPTAWLTPSDLECIICYQVLRRPVTTPCGHTFCRGCIERILYYTRRCALCSRSLGNFCVSTTCDTTFVNAALLALGVLDPPSLLDSGFIPIFACTVAFPGIPCPLLIFDHRFWGMIQQLLDSGSRKFGMVAIERDRSYSNFGTIVEVRDCVRLEDGRSILSTVGVTRFQIIERAIRDGCHMARIEVMTDKSPCSLITVELNLLARQISEKALTWLSTLNPSLVSDIEMTFGRIPQFEFEDEWWEDPDGPQWLWWLVAVLPLKSEIQLLMLSTRLLIKRLLAVLRTLAHAMLHRFHIPAIPSCDLNGEIYISQLATE